MEGGRTSLQRGKIFLFAHKSLVNWVQPPNSWNSCGKLRLLLFWGNPLSGGWIRSCVFYFWTTSCIKPRILSQFKALPVDITVITAHSTLSRWMERGHKGTVNLKARGPPKLNVACKGPLWILWAPNLSNISGQLLVSISSLSSHCPKAASQPAVNGRSKGPGPTGQSLLRSQIPWCRWRRSRCWCQWPCGWPWSCPQRWWCQWWSRRTTLQPLQHTTSHPGLTPKNGEKLRNMWPKSRNIPFILRGQID